MSKYAYQHRVIASTIPFEAFCQCLNFNNFLNIGVFQKYYTAGGSMEKMCFEWCKRSYICVDKLTYTHTSNFIADVCLHFWHERETFVVVVSHVIGDIVAVK